MLSSTSSSSERAPELPWLWVWGIACVVLLAGLGGSEAGWRSLGHRPSVLDDRYLWSAERDQVHGARTLAIIGASRIKGGFCTSTFRAMYPDWRCVQLAVVGSSCLPVLRDLAEDGDFTGTVLCSTVASELGKPDTGKQSDYVAYHREQWSLNAYLNREVSTWLQSRLVCVGVGVSLPRTVKALASGRLPQPPYVRTLSDRSNLSDYTLTDADRLADTLRRGDTRKSPTPPARWLTQALRVDAYVEQIQARAGRVVFLRMPTSGEHWVRDEAALPRGSYWDSFARATRARVVHFADVPALRGFRLPDTSHLDHRDAAAFTRGLLLHLAATGVLPAPVDLGGGG